MRLVGLKYVPLRLDWIFRIHTLMEFLVITPNDMCLGVGAYIDSGYLYLLSQDGVLALQV